MCLPGQLISRLDRVDDDMLSEFLCHTLLSKQDGTYVDSRRWESAQKGDPVHGFISDMLAACLSASCPSWTVTCPVSSRGWQDTISRVSGRS